MSEFLNMERTRAKVDQPGKSTAESSLAAPALESPQRPGPNRTASGRSGPVAASPATGSRVAELQVTAHLMTLETGLFCVFQAPGGPPPDPLTSLPGVRITLAPGVAGRPEAVSVSTFREDGWLNGTAALVRVANGSAQILVTIYQDRGQDAAPRWQVLRLSGEPNAALASGEQPSPATERAAAPAPAGPTPEVMAHVQRMGDVTCDLGNWLGTRGSGQWMEGFGIAPNRSIAVSDIEYQAVLGRNWLSPWVEGGKYCGSRGMALPLLGLKIRLRGEAVKAFECSYSATFVDGSAAGPVEGGEVCEAESLAALEAFQVVIRPRDAKSIPSRTDDRKPLGKIPAQGKSVAQAPAGAALPAPAATTPRPGVSHNWLKQANGDLCRSASALAGMRR